MALRPSTCRRSLLLSAVVAVAVFYAVVDPSVAGWLPRCWWVSLTGTLCPACGAQRAAHTLLQGRVADALGYNWFLDFTAVIVLLVLASDVFPLPRLRRWLHHRAVLPAYLVLTLVWWIMRNILNV